MSPRRRLALLVLSLPVAFYAYACSSSDSDGGGTSDDDAGGSPGVEGGGPGPGVDSSVEPGIDSSVTPTDGSVVKTDSGDASDGSAPVVCLGNPLFPDGGTPDGGANVDAGVVEIVVGGPFTTFLDGPQWVSGTGGGGGGFLVYSEYADTEQIHRVGADGGAASILRTAGLSDNLGPIGNAVRNGVILTTASGNNGAATSVILQTAFDGGALAPIPVGQALSPNDLVVHKSGAIFFTDPRYQVNGTDPKGFYATLPDAGGVTRVAMFTGEEPNGIALTNDQTKLYIGFTIPKRVDSYPVSATGVVTATATAVIAGADITDNPDGLAVDVGGNIWVAEANSDGTVRSGRVEVFTPAGKRYGQILFPTERPTGVAFGGPENKTLFITTERGVFSYVGRCAGTP